jgi:NADH dehydrogenase [ubiquinone] 1 alpha subcomplex assembly factor 7
VNALGRLLRRIESAGPLTVADFMSEALLDPRHGYYTTRDPLGAAGDFITAPEVSQIFGELIGLWCADQWEKMARPKRVVLAELGPGRGTLMTDALRAAARVPAFREALELHLVEASPVLRAAQSRALAATRPVWHDSIATLPEGPLLLVANEFLDALPIRQLQRGERHWHERLVGRDAGGEGLSFVRDAAPSALAALLPPAASAAAPGTIAELRPAALSLAATLGARLAQQGGAALFIDYGYYPSACGETLQAVRRHQYRPVLAAPGEADLTAHVDFGAFAAAARQAGARAWGPVPQGAFLSALGLAERASALLRRATPAQAAAIESGCRRLIAPEEMGTLFKALALTHPDLPAPAGMTEECIP